MPSRRAASIASVVAVLQSMLAAIGWWFCIGVFVDEQKVDLGSPNHQVPIFDLAFIFAPVLWLTLTAILSLFQTRSGWWLSVLTDLPLAAFGAWLLMNDIVDLAIMHSRRIMVEDVIELLVLFVLPLTALVLLFSHSMRAAVGIGQRVGRNR